MDLKDAQQSGQVVSKENQREVVRIWVKSICLKYNLPEKIDLGKIPPDDHEIRDVQDELHERYPNNASILELPEDLE